jgi:hypothetical protein
MLALLKKIRYKAGNLTEDPEELVSGLADALDCSEYQIFKLGYEAWNRSGFHSGFVQYIQRKDSVPWWVTAYCRVELPKALAKIAEEEVKWLRDCYQKR